MAVGGLVSEGFVETHLGSYGATAKNAGLLDIKYRSEKKNSVRVLLLIDVGGSMDDHAKSCEQVFSVKI